MGIRIEELTERDIRKFKREIEGYEKRKKLFLVLGFVFLGLTILFLICAVLFGIYTGYLARTVEDYWSYVPFYLFFDLCITTAAFASTFCVATILMFILRGVLFAKKTENRLAAIEEYELYQKELNKKASAVEVADEVKE